MCLNLIPVTKLTAVVVLRFPDPICCHSSTRQNFNSPALPASIYKAMVYDILQSWYYFPRLACHSLCPGSQLPMHSSQRSLDPSSTRQVHESDNNWGQRCDFQYCWRCRHPHSPDTWDHEPSNEYNQEVGPLPAVWNWILVSSYPTSRLKTLANQFKRMCYERNQTEVLCEICWKKFWSILCVHPLLE